MEIRDIPLPGGEGLWVRLFLPPHPPPDSRSIGGRASGDGGYDRMERQEERERIPVVLYAHGGAYCWGQPDWEIFSRFCSTMALLSGSIWISLAYRLAPAHRLPAQFEDGYAALMWLRAHARHVNAACHGNNERRREDTERDNRNGDDKEAAEGEEGMNIDEGLARAGDFSRVFLAGESAGATIMLSVAMRAAATDVAPLRIKGLVLIHPGFHTEAKRKSMEKGDVGGDGDDGKDVQVPVPVPVPMPVPLPIPSDAGLPGSLGLSLEQMYEAALPQGEDLDYPGINPLSPRAPPLTPLSAYPHLLVCIADADLRRDLSLRFCDAVRRPDICPNLHLFLTPLKGHVFHLLDPDCPQSHHLRTHIAQFLLRCSSSDSDEYVGCRPLN